MHRIVINFDVSKKQAFYGARESPWYTHFYLFQNHIWNKYAFAALRFFPILIMFGLLQKIVYDWQLNKAADRWENQSVRLYKVENFIPFSKKRRKKTKLKELWSGQQLFNLVNHCQSLLCHWYLSLSNQEDCRLLELQLSFRESWHQIQLH